MECPWSCGWGASAAVSVRRAGVSAPARRIDAERGDVMLGPGRAITGSAAAGRDIQIASRCMRPGILHAGRQRDGLSLDQLRARDIHVIVRQIGPDVCIERDLSGRRLSGSQSGAATAPARSVVNVRRSIMGSSVSVLVWRLFRTKLSFSYSFSSSMSAFVPLATKQRTCREVRLAPITVMALHPPADARPTLRVGAHCQYRLSLPHRVANSGGE